MYTFLRKRKREVTMSSENTDWKIKINGLIQSCQNELKKTTLIGKKMLSASQANAKLHETYESIGRLVKKEIKKGNLKFESDKLDELLTEIETLESQLEIFENEVQDIKKSQ